MCFATKLPDPKPAPPPPNKEAARKDTVDEQRRRFAGATGRNQTILTRLSDSDVRAPVTRKRLLGE